MPFANNNGVRLHWQAQGEGTPVLLIMGLRFSSGMWYPILPALIAKHRVIWFDNRGTGESDTTRSATVRDLMEDALSVMDAASVERAHVFGVSMGGGIALELAQRQPQRVTSLLLGCTCILTADKPRMPAFMRTLYRLPPWILKLLVSRRANGGYGSAASAKAIAQDQAILANDKHSVTGVIAQAAAVAGYVNTKEAVAALNVSTLVMHGDEDAVVPYAWGVELAETLPSSHFVKFEGAGHNFLVAAGQKASDEVLNFIEEVDRRTSSKQPIAPQAP